MSSPYPVLDNRPIDKFKVTELKEELKKRKLPTKGLKEDLIRRLDEALRQEQDADLSKCESGCGSPPTPEEEIAEPVNAENSKDGFDAGDMTDTKVDENIDEVSAADIRVPLENIGGCGSTPMLEEEISEAINAVIPKDGIDAGDMTDKKVDENIGKVNAADIVLLDEGKVSVVEPVDVVIPTIVEKDQIGATTKEEHIDEVSVVQTSDLGSVTVEFATALSGQGSQNCENQNENKDVKEQLENHTSKYSQVEAKVSSSNLENQVSEVSPVLGFQVTCVSVSSDVSIDEKTELKDNISADEVKLEVDCKPEMAQLTLSSVVPDNGESHPMDVEEPHKKKVFTEEPGNENDKNVDISKTDFNVDSAEKLQLDRSPGDGDDSMEEDVSEGKIDDSRLDFEKIIDEKKEIEVKMSKEEVGSVAFVDDARTIVSKKTFAEDNGTIAQSMKRKAYGTAVGSNDIVKRQRGLISEDLKVPENKKGDALSSTTPKDFFQPSFRRSFSRSDSMVKEEPPKERVVPLTSKAPSNSLLIENFLRPFTLKAVKDLLGKTGTVTNFWMDAIKTHCYVSFSSVEEAIETRNAVYNLQWPPNGGKLLVADFVDPQEVKDKVEAPPQPPLTPATPARSTPIFAAPPSVQPQPSPRQLMQNKPLQPPPSLPPPPSLSNPPPLRKLPIAKDQHSLPPPPLLPVKVDPPIVTLDDLFRKTKATPRIYYLPLSDEQVAAKLKAQGNSIKQ